MQIVDIDLIPQEEKPIINVSQFDNNWDIEFHVKENGEDINLSPGDTITCIIRKPDNNIVTLEGTLLYPQNKVKVSLTEQACACYGRSWGEISIDSGTKHKGTCNFILEVEISPEYGGIDSSSEIANLTSQITDIVEDVAAPIVGEIAAPIVTALVPEIIGDNYYTKTQIQTDYYTKIQTDTAISNAITAAKPKAIIQTLEAGETVIIFTTTLSAAALVEFKINEPDVNEPTIVESTSDDNRIFTLTFDSAFDHDVSIMLLNVLYEV